MKAPEVKMQIHLNCLKYSKNTEKPLIEIRHYEGGTMHQITTESNVIVVVLSGVLSLHSFQTFNKQIISGQFILLSIKSDFEVIIKEDSTLAFFRLDTNLNFCDHISFEVPHRKKEESTYIFHANNAIMSYLNHLIMILNDGFYCDYLLEIKLKEFLYLLRYYYPLGELKTFFAPILNEDFAFSTLIKKNYNSHLNVSDLAKKTNYSISGFGKRFKKVFGISPSQWMQFQKAQAIYHEINCSTKTFAELGYEFGFSSPSHFSNFCKKIFNKTPGSIRSRMDGKIIKKT
ncbi:MAG: AraC family transcriptional regulator [Bacteroidetes bacterium]|nr:AraC family transcriptional regulator [Bacteroidota bacterium]MCL2303571.1 AraC family transcriptional regulator [Lentimicrobiaceae bacterium]